MAAEPTTRFAHLLQPIRDLSKVWRIEIADELEKYIEEVAQLIVLNPEDGLTQLNFAEAALLIQGSTAIYSRKVELLYQLVYQALDLLVPEKSKDAPGRKAKGVQSGLWAPIPDTEELLTIDHLLKEGRGIMLESIVPEQRQAMQRRVPLFLLPRDQADRRKREFRISSCTVHNTGVYLLQESDAKLLDELLGVENGREESRSDAPLVPAPPREVQDLDDRLQALLREMPLDEHEHARNADETEVESPRSENDFGNMIEAAGAPPAPCTFAVESGDETARRSTEAVGEAQAQVRAATSEADPWALLDEHATGPGQDVPLEVGKTSKRLNKRKLSITADSLPDVCSYEALSEAALWSGAGAASRGSLTPTMVAGHPVEALFLAVAGDLKRGGRYEAHRAGFSNAWLEFEDLFSAALGKRRGLRMRLGAQGPGPDRENPPTPRPEDFSGDEASDTEAPPSVAEQHQKGSSPRQVKKLDKDLGTVTPLPSAHDAEDSRREEQRREVETLENMIQDAQQKYEATIRQHLQAMQKDTVDVDNRKFPQLYANVRKWQEQLDPVLKEFESRPEFNIHGCSKKILAKLSNLQDSNGPCPTKAIPFARLVHGQPRWEICRRFLTCLALTNSGNTDIILPTSPEEERLNNFSVQLLNAEKKMMNPFDADDEAVVDSGSAATSGLPGRGGGRQRRVRDAEVDEQSAQSAQSAQRPDARPLKRLRKMQGA